MVSRVRTLYEKVRSWRTILKDPQLSNPSELLPIYFGHHQRTIGTANSETVTILSSEQRLANILTGS